MKFNIPAMHVHPVDFSHGKVSSCILKLSFPLIVAEIVNLLYNMVDRIYILVIFHMLEAQLLQVWGYAFRLYRLSVHLPVFMASMVELRYHLWLGEEVITKRLHM